MKRNLDASGIVDSGLGMTQQIGKGLIVFYSEIQGIWKWTLEVVHEASHAYRV